MLMVSAATCLRRSFDVQNTTASISQILEELPKPMNLTGEDCPLPLQAIYTDMELSMPERIWSSGSGIQRWRMAGVGGRV